MRVNVREPDGRFNIMTTGFITIGTADGKITWTLPVPGQPGKVMTLDVGWLSDGDWTIGEDKTNSGGSS